MVSGSGSLMRTDQAMARLIAETLEADGITQAEFSRRVGVSPKHVNQVLNGHSAARPAALDYWAFALGRRFVVTIEAVDG